jgi:hypothetical protein
MERNKSLGGTSIFFRLSLSSESLHSYYNTNFNLMHHHKWSLSEVENLLPWEKEIYLTLLIKALEEERKQQEMQQNR